MKILILGSGAREHALAWMFSKSKRLAGLFAAPGNAGTYEVGTNLDVDPMDFDAILKVCREHRINYVFVGPEDPLAAGVVDVIREGHINVIGPHKEAAQLEASKTFSKAFMQRHGIPTAGAKTFSDTASFIEYINSSEGRLVIKKSGLASGKGVLDSDDKVHLIEFGSNILTNDSLLVEEFLEGYEVSIFALCDGENFVILPPCSDFKKAYDCDKGPNTGGMGSICPVPWVDLSLKERIKREIIEPTFDGLRKDNLIYKGILYFGLMITKNGPKLLEYNVRFGDPETQVLLPMIRTDFGDVTEAIANTTLDSIPISENPSSAVGVVVASAGYPGSYRKEIPVRPIREVPEKSALIFHATTKIDENRQVVTGGGRCFTVVGLGKDTIEAASMAYSNIDAISFEGAWYRKDIGKKFFIDGE
ncbi:MAG: phosphoribosylamine--glycine ligase [Spirochaetales bacterium]|nr:phosphoribosylamine--glycine ligase [Spirochaetales bacterium]